MAEGLDVVLQMLHIGHAAENGEDFGKTSAETKSPGGNAQFGFSFLQTLGRAFREFGQTASEQGLHDDDGNVFFGQFAI